MAIWPVPATSMAEINKRQNNVSRQGSSNMPNAIVLRPGFSRPLVDEFWPGWTILGVCQPLLGLRFNRIVVAFVPNDKHEVAWIEVDLSQKVGPGGSVEFLL